MAWGHSGWDNERPGHILSSVPFLGIQNSLKDSDSLLTQRRDEHQPQLTGELGRNVDCWKSTTNTSYTQKSSFNPGMVDQAIIPALGKLKQPYSISKIDLKKKVCYACVYWFIYIFCGCVHVSGGSHVCTCIWRSEVEFIRCLHHSLPYILRQSLHGWWAHQFA